MKKKNRGTKALRLNPCRSAVNAGLADALRLLSHASGAVFSAKSAGNLRPSIGRDPKPPRLMKNKVES
ncbi:MAG: hypothetical protein LBK41_04800 [Clostridiales bacterium]|jgi:hypothetical protein|nr:hypothetical protein [Clostridiales bacterium]